MNEENVSDEYPLTSFSVTPEEKNILDDLEADVKEEPEMSEAQIEDKYVQNQSRIYIQRNDFLIPNILQMVKNREVLNLSPIYQRRLRWSNKKKSQLIESLLMNVPIPPIFLYEKEFAKYEVMDGQQRLASIKTFYNNEFKLSDLEKWPELNGRYFTDLPSKIQSGLSRRGLAAVIVLTESGPDEKAAMELRQYVFERLNTGGEKLNGQEIRNCIYSSPFNEMLVRIARSEPFTSVWNIPPKEPGEPQKISRKLAKNSLYNTMADCQIVLRFFSLLDTTGFTGMRTFLDRHMDMKVATSEKECKRLEENYILTLEVARSVYEDSLFKLPKVPGKNNELTGRRSVPLADVVLLSINKKIKKSAQLIKNREFIIDQTRNILSDEGKRIMIVGRLGVSKKGIDARKKMFDSLMTKALKQ